MWFGKRRRYNEQVTALLPQLGFTIAEAGPEKTLRVLNTAWQNEWNAHEAALYVAFTVFGGMLKAGEPRAAVVRQNIRDQSRFWKDEGLVRESLVAAFERTAAGWVERFGASGLVQEKRQTKDEFIRALMKRRVERDPLARDMGFDTNMVDSLDQMRVAGMPEASIAAIVETYSVLRRAGVDEHEIFDRIEAHRAQLGTGVLPIPLTLDSYVMYRIETEHGDNRLPEQFITPAILACREYFGC